MRHRDYRRKARSIGIVTPARQAPEDAPDGDAPATKYESPGLLADRDDLDDRLRTDGGMTTISRDREPDPDGVREAADLIRRERGLETAIAYVQKRFREEPDNQAQCLVVLGELRRLKAARDRAGRADP